MKKALFISFLVFAWIQLGFGQDWISSNKISSSTGATFITIATKINSDGEVLTYGYFTGTLSSAGGKSITSLGGRDYYLIKFLTNGQVDWMKNFGSAGSDFVSGGLAVDASDQIYISGAFLGNLKYTDNDSLVSSGAYDMFILKLDETGTPIWGRNAGTGSKLQSSTALSIDQNDDLILAGIFLDSINVYNQLSLYSSNASLDYFYAKFESVDGDIQWIKHADTYSDLGGRFDNVYARKTSYLFTGTFYDSIGFETDTLVPYSNQTDVHLLSADIDGNIEWIRTIGGIDGEFSFSVLEDDNGNIYLSGYYNSDTLYVESSDTDIYTHIGNNGGFDLLVIKYNSSGDLEWVRTAGGKYEEKTFNMAYFDEQVWISGYFADTLRWGGNVLTSEGPSDVDMFTAALDSAGNFSSANSYSGRNGSNDQGRGILKNGGELYTLMRTNSDRVDIGDSIYFSDGTSYYMVLGVIGCNPITIENAIPTDVTTCYGDSTGSIQVSASGGFGAPWSYSIDNGETSQEDLTLFANLPAGEYKVKVYDSEGCAQDGPALTINEPEELLINVLSAADITPISDGHIEVEASGGTIPYTFMLRPDSTLQGFGMFTLVSGDSGSYVVEVNDAKGCGPVATDTIEILEIVCQTITVEIISTSDITSDGPGEIVVEASGGTSPYTYSLTPGSIEPNESGIFVITTEDTYTVEVQDDWNCGPVSTDPIMINDSSGVDISDYMYAKASVYPNPSNGEITIEMSTEASQNTLEVMSMTGQVLISTMVYPSGGHLKETLHLGDLAKGMYMLRVDGKMLRSAIVLQ